MIGANELINALFPRGLPTPQAIDSAALAEVATPALAIAAIRDWIISGEPVTSQRTVVALAAGDLLVMPAESSRYVGIKLATVAPANPARGLDRIQAVYQLFSADSLTPLACFDANAITALRTGAVSAVAIDALASLNAGRLVVFGTSIQAESHVVCMAEVRTLTDVVIAGRNPVRAAALAARLRARGLPARWSLTASAAQAANPPEPGWGGAVGEDRWVEAERNPAASDSPGAALPAAGPAEPPGFAGTSAEGAAALDGLAAADQWFAPLPAVLGEAELVATCTSSGRALFAAEALAPHVAVAAVGSHTADARELPGAALVGARLVVEDRDAAWREYGDLILARDEGLISEADIAGDLAECVRDHWGPSPGRTIFKSAGMGWEDLAVAQRLFEEIRGDLG
ncbi:MAG: hypothetical protein LBE08_02485 [Bifidobacteriaceae bacterium]|nr:hypothetical protein [Bifidobacteriaceae bacterium]